MALITCKDCGQSVSDVAPACPHCGRPRDGASTVLGRATGQHGATKILSILLALAGGFMFASNVAPILGVWLGVSGVVCFVIAVSTDKRG